MKATVTITLPGRPVTATLDADALPRYLLVRGGRDTGADSSERRFWRYDGELLRLPTRDNGDPSATLSEAVATVARIENRHPLDVLADLLPPTPGPALQWAHMSEAARAAALAYIDDTAHVFRTGAAHQRTQGDAERALVAEGRAMGLEAAAAALRAPVLGGGAR